MKYSPLTDEQLLEMIMPMPQEFEQAHGRILKNDVLSLANQYIEQCRDFVDLVSTLDEAREKARRRRLHLERWALTYIRRQVVQIVRVIEETRYAQPTL